MRFVAVKILAILVQPDCLLLLVGLAGLVLAWRGRRAGLWLVAAALGGFTLILVLPLGQWLLAPLEDRFAAPAPPPDQVAGIILLGGAQEVEITEARGIPSFNAGMETLTTFAALARRYPAAILAFSGGSGAMTGNRMSEADVTRALFAQIGLDRPVVYEDTSRDTFENATLLKRLVQPAGGIWLLVTTAGHMPRSVGAFRAAGWPVTAWPVAYRSAPGFAATWRHFDLGGHLSDLDTALHEWEGLIVYRLEGRTDAMFPGP